MTLVFGSQGHIAASPPRHQFSYLSIGRSTFFPAQVVQQVDQPCLAFTESIGGRFNTEARDMAELYKLASCRQI